MTWKTTFFWLDCNCCLQGLARHQKVAPRVYFRSYLLFLSVLRQGPCRGRITFLFSRESNNFFSFLESCSSFHSHLCAWKETKIELLELLSNIRWSFLTETWLSFTLTDTSWNRQPFLHIFKLSAHAPPSLHDKSAKVFWKSRVNS